MSVVGEGHFDHVFIVTSDLAASQRWYEEVLGFEEIRRSRVSGDPLDRTIGIPGATLDLVFGKVGGTIFELGQYADVPLAPNLQQPNIGVNGLVIEVSDARAAHARAVGLGIVVESEPIVYVGQAVLFYIQDPDGTRFEIVQHSFPS
jgi:catechol 2,3-dioxygenase-like lactoylglutathione lyase family enzyme